MPKRARRDRKTLRLAGTALIAALLSTSVIAQVAPDSAPAAVAVADRHLIMS